MLLSGKVTHPNTRVIAMQSTTGNVSHGRSGKLFYFKPKYSRHALIEIIEVSLRIYNINKYGTKFLEFGMITRVQNKGPKKHQREQVVNETVSRESDGLSSICC